MAVSYNLGFNPFWYFSDNSGKPLAFGKMYTYRALNHSQFKPVYSDAGGTQPYTNPIEFNANGMDGPFYFSDDENYYIVVTDADGNILFTKDNYNATSGGGGGPVTNYQNFTNLVTNGQFLFNASDAPISITTNITRLAPSNHNGLTQPDIVLSKNNTSSIENVSFLKFNLGDTSVPNSPRYYLRYSCVVIGSETKKDLEFPITAHVKNLENQVVTVSFWARSPTLSAIEVFTTQYFGDGTNSPSPPQTSTPQVVTLTNTFAFYTTTVNIPLTSGKIIGDCGNDYLVLSIRAPLGQLFSIEITNVQMLIGNIQAEYQYLTQDITSSVVYAPRTGDVKLGFDTNQLNAFGWVKMDDGTIGSSSSGATTRANIDTYPLYKMIYENVIDAWAPVSGGRSGDPAQDFGNNKTLTLTKVLGRALSGAGQATTQPTTWLLGQNTGHILTIPEMPAHDHPGSTVAAETSGSGTPHVSGATFSNFNAPLTIAPQGGNQPHNTMQPTTFMNVYIKL
jgi:hypothetical protein